MKLFITGIGTDVGKSWVTGKLANIFSAEGNRVITQKFIQTGNTEMSEDIELHRKIMGIPLQDVDKEHITCPVIFTYPASPHLAAKIDNREVDLKLIDEMSALLESRYDVVLIEGAGGIMVPITEEYLTIDYIRDRRLPAIVATNGYLGSISNTLLTLEAIKNRGIELYALVYNTFFDSDEIIATETKRYLKEEIEKNWPGTKWITI